MPFALQSKEEELQSVRDELRQVQEERDCHLKTISTLKQVIGTLVFPTSQTAWPDLLCR